MYKHPTIMHLVDDGTLMRVQNNLLQSKNIKNLHGSLWFNIMMFVLMVVVFIYFLMNQYTSTTHILQAEATKKDIPYQPNTFNNAVRNHIEL